MLAFATAFAAALLLGLGARDQMLVAGLSLRLGKRLSLVIIALMASALTSVLAIWAGETLASPASPLLAGLALIFAGLEMILRRPGPVPVEPTPILVITCVSVVPVRITTDLVTFVLLFRNIYAIRIRSPAAPAAQSIDAILNVYNPVAASFCSPGEVLLSWRAPEEFTRSALTFRYTSELAVVTYTSTVTPPVFQSALFGLPASLNA